MVSGELQAICGAPEWAAILKQAGTHVDLISLNDAFPAMAQAILASDQIIKMRPTVIRKFVRATLKAVKEIETDYREASKIYISALPQYIGKETLIEETLRYYATQVYPVQTPSVLGAFDKERIAAVQRFYLTNGIVAKAVPIDQLFTNEFVAP